MIVNPKSLINDIENLYEVGVQVNTQTQEALKMAIKQMNAYAFKHLCDYQVEDKELLEVIKACKEALAQPAQEPVAIVETHYGFTDAIVTFLTENNEQLPIGTLLYTHPAPEQNKSVKQWQGLSNDDMAKLCDKYWDSENGHSIKDIITMVEQELKRKNGF